MKFSTRIHHVRNVKILPDNCDEKRLDGFELELKKI